MINILIPLAGKNQYFDEAEYPYPKPLIEIGGKTIIEHVITNFLSINDEKQFIFIVGKDECKKYHLDNILNLLTNNTCKIIKVSGETKGAACSSLMAIESINTAIPLVIANADQLFDDSIGNILHSFDDFDAGVVTFDSIHPRWSFARVDEKNIIIETSEKRPISRHAIAGFYYFREGKDFVSSAMTMIKKDANINGLYYLAPTLNEMILNNKKLTITKVENNKYHTFYTPQNIRNYERIMRSC